MQARKPVNLLVVNYDRCLFGIEGTHRFMLSYPLIEFASNLQLGHSADASELDLTHSGSIPHPGPVESDDEEEVAKKEFLGFYGFSNRCINTLPKIRDSNLKRLDEMRQADKTVYEDDCLLENYPTYKITQNFKLKTGLNCFGVSTAEDYMMNLSEGYMTKIRPWELDNLNLNKKPKNSVPFSVLNDPDERAWRLTQIAQHAAFNNTNSSITLTYVNDDLKQCQAALEVPNSELCKSKWPSNVKLAVFQHQATGNEAPIDYIGTAEKPKARALPAEHMPTAGLHTSGFFSPSAKRRHAMQTRSTAAATNTDAKRQCR